MPSMHTVVLVAGSMLVVPLNSAKFYCDICRCFTYFSGLVGIPWQFLSTKVKTISYAIHSKTLQGPGHIISIVKISLDTTNIATDHNLVRAVFFVFERARAPRHFLLGIGHPMMKLQVCTGAF